MEYTKDEEGRRDDLSLVGELLFIDHGLSEWTIDFATDLSMKLTNGEQFRLTAKQRAVALNKLAEWEENYG